MTILYLAIAAGWGFLCYRHREEILPIQVTIVVVFMFGSKPESSPVSQFYVSALIGLLIMEMFANWGTTIVIVAGNMILLMYFIWSLPAYYRYLNAHGTGVASTAFLIVGMFFFHRSTI